MINTDSIFDNLMNGNLSDAQRLSKRISLVKLLAAAKERFQEEQEALRTTLFLKGRISFRELCADE